MLGNGDDAVRVMSAPVPLVTHRRTRAGVGSASQGSEGVVMTHHVPPGPYPGPVPPSPVPPGPPVPPIPDPTPPSPTPPMPGPGPDPVPPSPLPPQPGPEPGPSPVPGFPS